MIITGGTQTLLVSGCTEREHGEQDPWHPGAAETGCGAEHESVSPGGLS